MRRLVSLAIVFLMFAAAYADGEERQIIEGDALKDLDYGFVMKRPSDKWTFMKEEETAKLNVDAVAGMYDPNSNIFTLVVPEEMPQTKIEDYAQLLLDNMTLENGELVYSKPVTLNNIKAYQFKITGEINGVKFAYICSIFPLGDFYFQVVSWWPTQFFLAKVGDIDKIHSSFGFIPGAEPKVRKPKQPDELNGVGWRVKKHLYENAIYGFNMKLPTEDWRFMGSAELSDLDPDACLGLENSKAGMYVLFLAERLGSMTPGEYEHVVVSLFEEENSFKEHKASKAQMGGKEAAVHLYERVPVSNVFMDYVLVVGGNGKFGFTMTAWCLHTRKAKAVETVSATFDALAWLAEEERVQLAAELMKWADLQRSVEGEECFRNRTYRNFEYGVTLSFPEGFWGHWIGTDAQYQNEDASLVFTSLEHDLFGTLILEESEDFNGEEYHYVLLEALEAPEDVKTDIVKAHGQEIRSTRFSEKEGEQSYTYHLATVSVRGKHAQLLMFGLEGNLKETANLEKELLKNLKFTGARMPEVEYFKDGSYANYRLGFKLTPPNDKWKIEDMTAKAMGSSGTVIVMKDPEKKCECAAGAVHADVDVDELITDMVGQVLPVDRMNLEYKSDGETDWLGQKARLYTYEGRAGLSKKYARLVVTPIGGTVYLLVVVTGDSDDEMLDKLKEGFQTAP